jgi:metal-responsive CopG/Arc/MetJ family transcriptional regulator
VYERVSKKSVIIELERDLLEALDQFIEKQSVKRTRAETIRRILKGLLKR